MGLLKWFNKDNYATLGEVLSVIRKELQALQPKDSSDIVWNLSEDGLSAQLRSSNVGNQGTSEEGETVYTPTDTSNEYNGMHKLVLITDNSNPEAPIYKVCVCDGATYNPNTQTSGSSRVEVNNVSFDLDAEVFELHEKTAYIYVKFTAGTQDSQAHVTYHSGDDLQINTDTEIVYLIGRAVFKDGAFTVQQDHTGAATNGVIHIAWGTICNA